jgi:hypothetical protein
MQHLGEALGPELARVYQGLCVVLRSQGVVGAAPDAVAVPDFGSVAGEVGASRASALLNVKELRRLLSGALEGSAPGTQDDATVPGFPMTMPAALEALQEMNQVDQVLQRLKGSDAAHQGSRAVARALGQEVVALMVGNIAADPRLLQPVQRLVRRLEPALQRLAYSDPRFFSDRKHPSRRLLDEMTQRSLAWEAVDAPGFAAFIEPLHQAVEALVSSRVEGAEPFVFALETLEQEWGGAQQRDLHHRERAVRALLRAEQRNLLAEKIARDIRTRADVARAPREIASFIAGPWAQVMAQARLGDALGSADPGGYAALIADLVWTTQPSVAVGNVARLAKLSPALLDRLRQGLATIDYPAPATQRFLDHVKAAHQQAIDAAQQGKPPPLSTSMTRDEIEAMLGPGEDTGPGPWLGPTEAQHSGFMQTHESIAPRPLFQDTQPPPGDTRPGGLPHAVTDVGLTPGAWVEMLLDGAWARLQVTWASPHGTLFMFANAAGKTHSMTRRLLDKMLQAGTLRMFSGQAVVDGALDAVAQTALRNSLDIKL